MSHKKPWNNCSLYSNKFNFCKSLLYRTSISMHLCCKITLWQVSFDKTKIKIVYQISAWQKKARGMGPNSGCSSLRQWTRDLYQLHFDCISLLKGSYDNTRWPAKKMAKSFIIANIIVVCMIISSASSLSWSSWSFVKDAIGKICAFKLYFDEK